MLLKSHSLSNLLAKGLKKEELQRDERGRIIRPTAVMMLEKFGLNPTAEQRKTFGCAMNHLFPLWDQVYIHFAQCRHYLYPVCPYFQNDIDRALYDRFRNLRQLRKTKSKNEKSHGVMNTDRCESEECSGYVVKLDVNPDDLISEDEYSIGEL